MVEIRTLTPSVRISLPEKKKLYKPRSRDVVVKVRLLKDHPPPTPQPTPCRLWQGAVDGNGYGKRQMVLPDGHWKMVAVHRWVMEAALGRSLKPKEVILHACDQPLCYRVDHLSVGTIASNNADARKKGRAKKPPVNRLRGEKNGRSKLTEHQRKQIVADFVFGLTMPKLAEKYGVSRVTVSRTIAAAPLLELDRLPPHVTHYLASAERSRAYHGARSAAGLRRNERTGDVKSSQEGGSDVGADVDVP